MLLLPSASSVQALSSATLSKQVYVSLFGARAQKMKFKGHELGQKGELQSFISALMPGPHHLFSPLTALKSLNEAFSLTPATTDDI